MGTKVTEDSLDKVLSVALDDVLKAKTPEEKNDANERFVKAYKLKNERDKIENEKILSEERLKMEVDKTIADIEIQEARLEAETKARNKELMIRSISKGIEFGLFGVGLTSQFAMMHNNYIELNKPGQEVTRGLLGKFGNYLNG